MSDERSLRPTWAWLWTALAFVLLLAAASILTVIALSGRDPGEVALAVILIGFPALLGGLALGTMALITARPRGTMTRALRRWALALVAAVAFGLGIATLAEGGSGGILLVLAGVSALAFLALDWRRGRGGEE